MLKPALASVFGLILSSAALAEEDFQKILTCDDGALVIEQRASKPSTFRYALANDEIREYLDVRSQASGTGDEGGRFSWFEVALDRYQDGDVYKLLHIFRQDTGVKVLLEVRPYTTRAFSYVDSSGYPYVFACTHKPGRDCSELGTFTGIGAQSLVAYSRDWIFKDCTP